MSVTTLRSLVWASDLDVLGTDHAVEERDDHLVIRSAGNPSFWWGNFLLFDDAPAPGDGERWESLFDAAFLDEPRVRHRAFGWDRTDGEVGAAECEFVARGYELERDVGLVATPDEIRPHPRANQHVAVRALDPDGDAEQWEAIVELQLADRPPRASDDDHRAYARARADDVRALLRAGRGAWYVAQLPGSGELVADCGVIVSGDRGRFQTVVTAESHRRRGISSRLVVAAAHRTASRLGVRSLVIAANRDYHALGLYESLGFRRRELVCGAVLPPR